VQYGGRGLQFAASVLEYERCDGQQVADVRDVRALAQLTVMGSRRVRHSVTEPVGERGGMSCQIDPPERWEPSLTRRCDISGSPLASLPSDAQSSTCQRRAVAWPCASLSGASPISGKTAVNTVLLGKR
jgi:hypothetical protein